MAPTIILGDCPTGHRRQALKCKLYSQSNQPPTRIRLEEVTTLRLDGSKLLF